MMRAGLNTERGQPHEPLHQQRSHGSGRQRGKAKMKCLQRPGFALPRLRERIAENRGARDQTNACPRRAPRCPSQCADKKTRQFRFRGAGQQNTIP